MTATQVALLGVYALIVAVWPIRSLVLKVIAARLPFLDRSSPSLSLEESVPLVSAIIPAKDEEANLPFCLEAVGGQRYPRLEIIVIDDRSEDRTAQLALDQAIVDPRIRVLRNDRLPPGWTGKTWVLHQAANEARGEWLWFLDADTRHAPEYLGVMLEHARIHHAALVSVLPEQRCETFWERVVQPVAGIVLMQSFPLDQVNDDRASLAFANGQSILVRREAYDAAGGHVSVKHRFVEDIGLAAKVKELGRPIRVVMIRDLVACRMYATLGQLIRGWSRILYDALDRNPRRLLIRLLDPIVFCQSGQVALLAALGLLATHAAGPFPGSLLALSLVHHLLMYPVFRQVYTLAQRGSRHALWYPLANLVIDVILLRSIAMCFTGRVTWRGTSYGEDPSESIPAAAPRISDPEAATS